MKDRSSVKFVGGGRGMIVSIFEVVGWYPMGPPLCVSAKSTTGLYSSLCLASLMFFSLHLSTTCLKILFTSSSDSASVRRSLISMLGLHDVFG